VQCSSTTQVIRPGNLPSNPNTNSSQHLPDVRAEMEHTVETTLQIPYIAFEEQKHLNHFPVSMPTCMHQRSLHPYIQIIGNIQSNISFRIKIVETDQNVTRIYPVAKHRAGNHESTTRPQFFVCLDIARSSLFIRH
jgi:hypothetical protein